MRAQVTVALGIIFSASCARVDTVEEIRASKPGKAVSIPFAPGDWPVWRGPHGDGKSPARPAPPVTWGENENVLWKAPVPGRGHSSPIVVGDRVFLTTADEVKQVQSVLAFDRETGIGSGWKTDVHRGEFCRLHAKNSHASATLACDGERLFAVFLNSDALWMTGLNLEGEILWQTRLGPFQSEHGYGSSPVLWGSLVIASGDNVGSAYLVAVDRESGEIAWRTARPREKGLTEQSHGNYGTPIVRKVAGRDQVILAGYHHVRSYDPATGKELWSCHGPAQVAANGVATDGALVVASGGYPQKEVLCVRGDGSGNVNESHVVWRHERDESYVPTPVIHDGLVYLPNDNGILVCMRLDSGEVVWKRRMGGNFTASAVLAGDLLYLLNEEGVCFVVRTGESFALLAQNELDSEGGLTTPTIADGRIYLRTRNALYCLGEPAPQPVDDEAGGT